MRTDLFYTNDDVKSGYREEGKNPCRFVDKYKEKQRQRFLSTEEQERLSYTLERAMKEKVVSDYAIYAIRLLRSHAFSWEVE